MTILSRYGGFDSLIYNANRVIKKTGIVYIFYKRGKGFLSRKELSVENEELISSNKLSLVGTYTKINISGMREDFTHEVDLQFRD